MHKQFNALTFANVFFFTQKCKLRQSNATV